MPHGFFTVEEWRAPRPGAKSQWVPVLHLDARQTLTKAIEAIQRAGKPGFFRVVQTQREIWAELKGGTLRLRRWHASTYEDLVHLAQAFEIHGGRWPVEKARRERKAAMAKRVKET
jgi:hypothetical protein